MNAICDRSVLYLVTAVNLQCCSVYSFFFHRVFDEHEEPILMYS